MPDLLVRLYDLPEVTSLVNRLAEKDILIRRAHCRLNSGYLSGSIDHQ